MKAVSEKVSSANRIRKYTEGLNICGDAAHAPAVTNRVPHGYELSQSGIKQLSSLKTEIICRLRAQKIYSLKPIAELKKHKLSLPSNTLKLIYNQKQKKCSFLDFEIYFYKSKLK